MKPFNLEEYLKNPSRKLVTRDGRKVRIICTDRVGIFPIIGLISSDSIADFEEIVWYTKEGVCDSSTEKCHDLFFAPEKREGWINIYKQGNLRISDLEVWETKEIAKKWSNENCVATVKIEWEE